MNYNFYDRKKSWPNRIAKLWSRLHIDLMLLLGILALSTIGLFVIYSASNQSIELFWHQIINLCVAFLVMMIFAQIPTYRYQALVPWLFGLTLLLLFIVMGAGIISRGAQRWLNFGFMRFQPSELMKLAMPMMLAWYLRDKRFPLRLKELFLSFVIVLLPALIIAKQPDLGTALLVVATGCFVLLLTGISWKIIISVGVLFASIAPVVWHFLHSYQKMRLMVFLSPENDPFGSGYNIIQSKIAIGSGGWLGKGWLMGSQSYLQFLPERSTDFIFAVYAEEFGFVGAIFLFAIFVYIIGRSFYISFYAQDTFSRLLAGSLTLSFFTSFFVNIGMVMGVLPVVGVPLPLVSYGGSSLLTFMAGFGIIMAVNAHRKLMGS